MKLKNITFILIFILLLVHIDNIPKEISINISKEYAIINEYTPRKLQNKENYISILYRQIEFEYINGFGNDYRYNINFIESGDFKYNITEKFKIKGGSKIKIYFTTIITSFEHFFSSRFDRNVENIESIDFSNFDLSLITSFESSFEGCSFLKSIKFSNNISSILNLEYMFYQCSSLESIDLSNFDTSLVTNMEYIFYQCSSLKSINLSSFNTSLVKRKTRMFYGCSSLESIDLSNFDTSSVTAMYDLFYRCNSIISINLSSFNTSLINMFGRIFYECSSLESIDLSNFDTSAVTDMYDLFYGCSSLKLIDLSSFNTSLVKSFGRIL